MDKKATIYDIAREAGVSTATVTRVTSGSAKVKSSTRERVQRIIDAHGYVPSAAAHALESGQTHTIGLVMPSITNPYFARIYSTIYEEATANGYYVWLFQIHDNDPIPPNLIDEIIRRRMDGVIFAGGIWTMERTGLADALTRLKHHMPVVTICRRPCSLTASASTATWSAARACPCATCTRWGTGASRSSAAPCS